MTRYTRPLVWLLVCGALCSSSWVPSASAREGAAQRGGLVHTVDEGEVVWNIARAYGVSLADIRKANPGVNLKRVRAGDQLTILGATRRPPRAHRAARSPRAHRVHNTARRRAHALGLGTRKTAAALLMGRAKPEWIRAAGHGERLEGSLRWPVTKGWYVRGFGSGAGHYHQAVDIGGEVGWHVRAAAGGIVGYAGDELRGFGNVVIVIHRGGWITLYGHNERNKVVSGQQVKRGQVLAELGSTGRSKGPHVHFELLFQGENCAPEPLFRPGVRRRDGRSQRVRRKVWRDPDHRPRGLSCHPRKRHPGHAA